MRIHPAHDLGCYGGTHGAVTWANCLRASLCLREERDVIPRKRGEGRVLAEVVWR
jgi:hypothetical protein